MPGPLEIGGDARLTVADLIAVARDRRPIALASAVAPRLAAARRVVERHAAEGRAVYGLTTGLGAAVDTRLDEKDVIAFQARAIRARSVAVGDPLAADEVRATLAARLAGLARGASGVSPPFLDCLVEMLNRDVRPFARRCGSLGEADLAPLAGLLLPLVGEGEAAWDGRTWPGAEALRRAGVTVPPLGPKDAIALLNGTAWSTAAAALAVHEMGRALGCLLVAGALSLEGFRAGLGPVDARAVALRPAPGLERAAAHLRALLAGGDLCAPGAARRVQDPLSFRCLAPVHGVALLRLDEAAGAVEIELNGAGDSPAVLVGDGEMLSNVGFDTTALALSLEGLGLATSHAAALSAFRIVKLMSPGLTGLPRFLASAEGCSGFAPAQKTAAALEAEIRHLAQPLGVITVPVADGVEDYAPMTPRVADKTRAIARRLMRLATLELIVAAEAVDQRGSIRLGDGTAAAHRFVRAIVGPLADDRAIGEEIERLAEAAASGALDDEVRGALG